MNELGLFAGAGGGLLASRLLGWHTVCVVEIEPYCQRVLAQRQRDGHLESFPIWSDVRTFDGRPWRGRVDVVSGGFPCQDISSAGKGAGLTGDRSGLWFEMLRIIGEVRPAYVFAENSPNLRTRGLDVVLGGLARLGYDVAWGVLGAWHVGAPHRRNRMWVVGALTDTHGRRERGISEHAEMAGAPRTRRTHGHTNGERERCAEHEQAERAGYEGDAADSDRNAIWEQPGRGLRAHGPEALEPRESDWWGVHRFAGVANGLADRVERVRATGNGQVPAVAALAWRVLSDVLGGARG